MSSPSREGLLRAWRTLKGLGSRFQLDSRGRFRFRSLFGRARPTAAVEPPRRAQFARVEVMNPSDGGFWFWLLRFYAFGGLALGGLGLCAGVISYLYFASTLPEVPNMASYQAEVATTTLIRAWDGTPLAELAIQPGETKTVEARFPGTGNTNGSIRLSPAASDARLLAGSGANSCLSFSNASERE